MNPLVGKRDIEQLLNSLAQRISVSVSRSRVVVVALPSLVALLAAPCSSGVKAEGNLRVWHTIRLDFGGPQASETDSEPNPFLDYRLQVVFRGPSGQQYDVPGFFNGDGRGGAAGNVWTVLFTPDEPGKWRYEASFRRGPEVAVSLEAEAGRPVAFDGTSGSMTIGPRDPEAPGFLKWGRLEYAGGHYLKFTDGPYWIRGGTDSPENFLAYEGFDNTPPSHRYAGHTSDWRPGDPDWGGGRGKAIIGVLNSLAAQKVNSIYFLTMNIGGDGKDVWPWTGTTNPAGSEANDNLHFDLSKLGQWEIVFDHALRQGVFLHFVFNEAEEANKRELDDGELGTERKLYYRELIARFGHHLALQWNFCEEYNHRFDYGVQRIREFAEYVHRVDPYDHPMTVHSSGDPLEKLRFTFGNRLFSMTSIQLGQMRIDSLVEDFRSATAAAGRPLPISMDEFTVDTGRNRGHIPIDDIAAQRKQKLWPTYLSGGMIEFILEELIEVESFKTPKKRALWNYTWYARKFLEENLPFWEMEPADELVDGEGTILVGIGNGESFQLGAQVLAKANEIYAIYLPKASPSGQLDLSGTRAAFRLRWYNPRTGEFEGASNQIKGGEFAPLGAPPADPSEDWAVLVAAE